MSLSDDLRTVRWLDVGECPFTHSIFEWSLESFDPGHRNRTSLETGLSLLAQPDFELDALEPTVFIFHMSRCGSSLLARAFAQSPRVIVMSEVPSLNQALAGLCGGDLASPIEGAERRRVLRNLILALGRRRRESQRYYAVKFTSWNAMLLRSLMQAFPKTRCLFLYRQPVEVIVSLLQRPPGWVGDQHTPWAESLTGLARARLEALSQVQYVAAHLDRLMTAGSSAGGIDPLNYADIDRRSFAALLGHLGIECAPEEGSDMTAEFDFHAKVFQRDVPFVDDTAEKQRAVTDEIREAASGPLAERYAALEASGRNLRSVLAGGREGERHAD